MKLNKQSLISVLKQTSPAITDRGSLPILDSIRFKDGKAMTTNLRLTIIVPFEGIDGVLPHKLLLSILNATNEIEIELRETNGAWELIAGKQKHKLGKAADANNFPNEPTFEAENSITLTDDQVMHIKNAAKFSGEEASGVEGVYIGKDIVGTEGHFIYKHFFGTACKLHVPDNFVSLLPDAGGTLNYNNRFVSVESNGAKIITGQLEAKYPAYETVFKSGYEWNISLSRAVLLSEIKSVLAYAPALPVVEFIFEDDKCTLQYFNADFEQEYNGQIGCVQDYNNSIKLHIVQLQIILNCFTDDEIELSITAPNKSVYIREKGNENTITLIQPNA